MPNANISAEEDDVTSIDSKMPTYAAVLQSFHSTLQFVCAHDGIADLLTVVTALERKLALQHRHWMQHKITNLFI